MPNLTTNMPLIEVPLVDRNGNISETWFMFLVQLFRRTGGGSGGGNTSLTVGDVLALEETFAAACVSGDDPVADMVIAAPGRESRMAEMVLAYSGPTMLDQTFSTGTDFTPGTTTSLSLNASFADAAHLWVFFDGTYQGDDQYALNNVALTFTAPIPVGVSKVYVKGLL